MLTRQSWIALGIAVVLGLFAVYIANAYLSGKEDQAAMRGTTRVAVAASPLAFGTTLSEDKVRFVDYPSNSVPLGAFTDAKQLLAPGRQRVTLMPIGFNEPILSSKISGVGQGASIAALLPAGKRAATVRINDVSGVAGFVQPNDTVDILFTRTVTNNGGSQQLTDVLLQNIRVLAIDQQAKNDDGSPKVAKTATLEVDPLAAQKLALAQEVGSLSLVLRKPGEQDNPIVETVSMNDLRYNMYGGARYPAPAMVGTLAAAPVVAPRSPVARAPQRPAAPARARQANGSIEVFRGTKSDRVKVGSNGR